MGNQHSLSGEKNNTDDKLLRRNMRSAFSHLTHSANQTSNESANAGADANAQCLESEAQRQARSRSLEPRAAQDIYSIEHSKSARYGGRHKKKHSAHGSVISATQLWNPEEQRLELLRMQLQNPLYGSRGDASGRPKLSISHLKDDEFRRQLRTIVLMNKRNDSLDTMDNNVTEQEHLHRSITGLSSHQTQILQKIWTRATESDVMDCTQNIFSHLLRSNNRMYQFFNLTDKTDKEILESATFARQSANFAMVFDYVIMNMNDLEKVCFALQCLGERHTRLAYPIENSHWLLFMRVFEDNPPKIVFQNAEGHAVWKTMISFIVQQMRIGYDRVVPEDDPGVQPHHSPGTSLDVVGGCPLGGGGASRELARRRQFASQRHPATTVSASADRSMSSGNRRVSNNATHLLTTTTSCV